MPAVLRGKFVSLKAFIEKLERLHISKVTAYLKNGKQKANTPKRNRRQEIVKLRAEINQLETKRMLQRIKKLRTGSLRK